MYKRILVALDNSEDSIKAEKMSALFAKKFKSTLTGFHAYSGRFHRERFRIIEKYLPEKYQKEEVLHHQRNIHSVLIERGMEIISLEYMKRIRDECEKLNINFKERIIDGKNSDQIIEEAKNHHLLIIGAQGLGKVNLPYRLGSNSRRALQHTNIDLLLVKRDALPKKILVGIDGSKQSQKILEKVIKIAHLFDSEVFLVSCFEPLLHRFVFESLVNVLSEEAGKVFKFREQEDLHNKVIDQSLAELYSSYLNHAKSLLERDGISVKTELLEGKPYYSLWQKSRAINPDLIIVGKFGLHQGKNQNIGSTTENISEIAECNILILAPSEEKEKIQEEALKETIEKEEEGEGKIIWSEEAKERLKKIPAFARTMAILSIEKYARQENIKVIRPEVMKKAKEEKST
jgi:nucleotide-binding universal stress UspA family protein